MHGLTLHRWAKHEGLSTIYMGLGYISTSISNGKMTQAFNLQQDQIFHLGNIFGQELPTWVPWSSGLGPPAIGGGEVLAMSAGSSLEDTGLAIHEGGATSTGVVGAAHGWHVSLEAPALG